MYTIRATNALGSAESSVNIVISSGKGLLLDSDHQDALDKIKYLESKHQKTAEEEMAAPEKPQFGRPLKNITLEEGQPAHFETTLTPVNDASMKVEWLFNGQPVPQGHRFRTTYDFGFVALDILYAYPEDSGTYMCKATNKMGEAVNTGSVSVQARQGLLLDSQHPEGWEKMRAMESRNRNSRLEVEEPQVSAPKFVTQLQGLTTLEEGQAAHFEAQIE